jgi:hypothetical protein
MLGAKVGDARKIERPVQLLAGSLIGLLIIEAEFLTAANQSSDFLISRVLALFAPVFVLAWFYFLFSIFTKHRSAMMTDEQLIEYRRFEKFQPKAIQSTVPDLRPGSREAERQHVYDSTRGLFVIHSWRSSKTPGQLCDISINIQEHDRNRESIFSKIDYVEYYLGPSWSEAPFKVDDARSSFKLDVSAWGSTLCLANISFKDGHSPVSVYRYLNFDLAEAA